MYGRFYDRLLGVDRGDGMAAHGTCITKLRLTNPILYALSAKLMLAGLGAAVDSTFPEAYWAFIVFLHGRCCRWL